MRNVVVGATFEKQRHDSRQMQFFILAICPALKVSTKQVKWCVGNTTFHPLSMLASWIKLMAKNCSKHCWGHLATGLDLPKFPPCFNHSQFLMGHEITINSPWTYTKIDHGFHILPGPSSFTSSIISPPPRKGGEARKSSARPQRNPMPVGPHILWPQRREVVCPPIIIIIHRKIYGFLLSIYYYDFVMYLVIVYLFN